MMAAGRARLGALALGLVTGRAPTWLLRRRSAHVYSALAVVGGVALFIAVNHGQWFVRDDWAFVSTRDHQRRDGGWDWLLEPQNGHFMAVPVALLALVDRVFGLDSYAPFLGLAFAAHLVSVGLVGAIARRSGAGPWATAGVCGILGVFGSGWENLVFAVQITFNLSMACALAQLVLADHRGRVGRRDLAAAAVGIVGVMSSGYGVILAGASILLLGARRRWASLTVVALPGVLVFVVWYLAYGDARSEPAAPGSITDLAEFAGRGLAAAAGGLVGGPGLGLALGGMVLAVILVLALGIAPPGGWRSDFDPPTGAEARWFSLLAGRLNPTAAAVAAAVAAPTVVALQRAGLGPATGSSSRYVYMIGFLLAPALAVASTRVVERVPVTRWLVVGLFVIATGQNVDELDDRATRWATDTDQQRRTLELLAGSPAVSQLDPQLQPIAPWSPDVFVRDLPELVERGAISPRPPSTPDDQAILESFGLA